jgi:hypothetical protein
MKMKEKPFPRPTTQLSCVFQAYFWGQRWTVIYEPNGILQRKVSLANDSLKCNKSPQPIITASWEGMFIYIFTASHKIWVFFLVRIHTPLHPVMNCIKILKWEKLSNEALR